MPGFGLSLAVDGDLRTSWRAESLRASLELRAAKPFAVSKVELVFPAEESERPKEFALLAGLEGSYKKLGGGSAKERAYTLDLPSAVMADSVKFVALRGSSYATGIAEFRVFSDDEPEALQAEKDIAPLARVYSSFRRCLHPGEPISGPIDDGSSKAVDGNPASVWKVGPYAQLFLLFGSPVRISRVRLDFGSREGRCVDYELQAMKDGLWTKLLRVDGNGDAVREHRLNPAELSEGLRLIPLKTAQLSATNLASFEAFSLDTPAPFSPKSHDAARLERRSDEAPKRPFGIFAVDHWRDFYPMPDDVFVDGVEYYALWQELEPEEGVFKWEALDEALDVSYRHKQRVVLKFVSDIYCPDWIFKKGGVPKALPDASKGYNPPVFWNGRYLELLSRAVHKLGERYDGDPAIDSVILTLAGTGEMGRFGSHPHAAWEKAGYSDEAFANACKRIVDIYRDSFKKTPLTVQLSAIGSNNSIDPALLLSEYAAPKGVSIEQAAFDDLMDYGGAKRASAIRSMSFIELFKAYRGKTALSAEANAGFCYNLSSSYPQRFPEVLWQYFLNCLGMGVEHISAYPPDLLRPDARGIVEFARRRLGKTPENSPSAWIGLRGEPLPDPSIGLALENASRSIPSKELVEKRLCRSTDIANGANSLDFSVAPAFRSRFKGPMKARVIYLDAGRGSFRLVNGCSNGEPESSPTLDRFSDSPIPGEREVRKSGGGAWRQAFFLLPAAPEKFSVEACGDDAVIHFVELAPFEERLEDLGVPASRTCLSKRCLCDP